MDIRGQLRKILKLLRKNRTNELSVCEYVKHFLTEIMEHRDVAGFSSMNGLLLCPPNRICRSISGKLINYK